MPAGALRLPIMFLRPCSIALQPFPIISTQLFLYNLEQYLKYIVHNKCGAFNMASMSRLAAKFCFQFNFSNFPSENQNIDLNSIIYLAFSVGLLMILLGIVAWAGRGAWSFLTDIL